MNAFSIVADEWLKREHPDPIDAATLAKIRITAGDITLSRLHDKRARTVRDHANLSAYALAAWAVENWWRLLHEPQRAKLSSDWRMAHEMPAIGGGYVSPGITFGTEGSETRQELLFPWAEMRERFIAVEIEEEAIEEAAADYGVSPHLVATTVVNRRRQESRLAA